jgi:hypothetical protein
MMMDHIIEWACRIGGGLAALLLMCLIFLFGKSLVIFVKLLVLKTLHWLAELVKSLPYIFTTRVAKAEDPETIKNWNRIPPKEITDFVTALNKGEENIWDMSSLSEISFVSHHLAPPDDVYAEVRAMGDGRWGIFVGSVIDAMAILFEEEEFLIWLRNRKKES